VLAGRGQPVEREGAQRLEHPVAGAARAVRKRGVDHRSVHQMRERATRVGVEVQPRGHRLGRGQVEPVDEDPQVPEQAALVVGQQLL
jgi:hypothetical protein